MIGTDEMKYKRLAIIAIVLAALALALKLVLYHVANDVAAKQNAVQKHAPYKISKAAQALHDKLIIGDWHGDATLWQRDLARRSDIGHIDLPRLQQGNVALQMFTTVTKSPRGQNYHANSADSFDNITALAMAQGWPLKSWNNLTERALYQAQRIKDLAAQEPQQLQLVLNQQDLAKLLEQRKQGKKVIGALLGTEGSHALEGQLDNIDRLYAAGFRMMSLQHFFDNRLGGSLHGQSKAGLSEFGKAAIKRMLALDLIIDVSHSSPAVVKDVLAISHKPLVVSHTGFYGACKTERNISDELMQQIAKAGGLIAVGFWRAAVCDISPEGIAKSIAYGIELVGAEHVALGSDFDGAVTTALDASELAAITQALLKQGISERDIALVMGGNMVRFLQRQLPDN